MNRSFRSLIMGMGILTLASTAAGQDLAAWNARTGREWRLTTAPELNGLGKFLWGAQAEAAFTPQNEGDWFELARQAFDAALGIFQIADVTLQPVSVRFLELSRIGSSDKVSVELRQVVRGVPVQNASLHALFTPQGGLLALDSNGLPGVERLAVRPVANRWEAVTHARAHFAAREGMSALTTGEPELLIVRDASGAIVMPRLVWSVELRNEANLANPAARRIFVAADDASGAIVAEESLIQHQQIQGHVESWATPGIRAGSAVNPPALHLMPHLTLTSSAGSVTTDAAGDFTFNSAVPLTFTAGFSGPYCRVENQAGSNHTASLSFTPGVPATLTMNPSQAEFPTAEASCFDSVLDVRAWLKSIDPNDTTLDFPVLARPNLNAACNAFYNGNSINFYRELGGCPNSAFSTLIAHELGHWMNDLYGSGNGAGGFGDGNADVIAMYAYDTPYWAVDFLGNGLPARTGENTRPFCGDVLIGCHGEVHMDGEVLMGALWKVRAALNVTLGNAAGDLTADSLWVAWMQAFNDGQIRTVIEDHWLALDDDDGNLLNGTPNYGDIDAGFLAQGFPGVDLNLISVAHNPITHSMSEAGPYVAIASLGSTIGSTVTGAELVYQTDSGAAGTLTMAPAGGGRWSGGIPGQPSPAVVRYHLIAHDAAGNAARHPRTGEFDFVVGARTTVHFNDFEGATDEGWTHGTAIGVDDWERGAPLGLSSDPAAAYSGSNVWGNDLSGGIVADNSTNYLLSPEFDCTGRTGVRVRFARHLTLNNYSFNEARLLVNGVLVWASPANGAADVTWKVLDYDISAIADGQPSVRVRFRLESGIFSTAGGWNVDDFEIYSVEAVPAGLDEIVLSGPTLVPAGAQRSWSFSSAPPNSAFWLLNGASAAGTQRQGHAFNVGAPILILASGTTNGNGNGAVMLQVPQAAAGRTGFFEAAVFAAGLWHESNLLTVLVH